LNDGLTQVVIDKEAPPNTSYDEFQKALPKDDCRYAVFDFEYDQADGGGKRSKILFVVWYVRRGPAAAIV
jgi:cofilin